MYNTTVTVLEKLPEIDTIPPVITLLGDETIELEYRHQFIEPGFTAHDDVDGDITYRVIVTGSVDSLNPGFYNIVYTVSDRAGNTATVNRVVIVLPEPVEDEPEPVVIVPTPPILTIIGSNPIILHLGGSPYIEQGADAYYDNTEGETVRIPSNQVEITGNVDITVLEDMDETQKEVWNAIQGI